MNMCFKRWFSKPDPIPTGKKKTALLFAINNYPGSANDLNGCLNDMRDVEKMLNDKFPGFVIKKFADAKATVNYFIIEVTEAIKNLVAGDVLLVHYSGHGTQVYDPHGDEADSYDEAIYLYDGAVIDDDIGKALQSIPDGATVCLMFDSCFSGTVTRILNRSKHPAKNKFMPMKDIPVRKKKRIRFPKSEMKWIVYSGCKEDETSADAYLSGEYHGAFTYFALKVLTTDMTYKQWIEAINMQLPNKNYTQTPTMEGNELLFTKQVFT